MQISKLSNMEAVYGLRELTRDVDSGINLADEPSVRAYVKTAAERALSDPAKISEFMASFEKPETAADVARAVLASVEEEPELIEDQAAKLQKILRGPAAHPADGYGNQSRPAGTCGDGDVPVGLAEDQDKGLRPELPGQCPGHKDLRGSAAEDTGVDGRLKLAKVQRQS